MWIPKSIIKKRIIKVILVQKLFLDDTDLLVEMNGFKISVDKSVIDDRFRILMDNINEIDNLIPEDLRDMILLLNILRVSLLRKFIDTGENKSILISETQIILDTFGLSDFKSRVRQFIDKSIDIN